MICCYESCQNYEPYSTCNYEKLLKNILQIHRIMTRNNDIYINLPSLPIETKSIERSLKKATCKWFKNNNYAHTLKNTRILILDGKHEGKEAIFKSWSGTTVNIFLIEENMSISISIGRTIEVFI